MKLLSQERRPPRIRNRYPNQEKGVLIATPNGSV